MKNFVIFGILFLGISHIVHSKPADSNELEAMQEDYYVDDESSDAGVANQQMKPSKPMSIPKRSKAYFKKPNSTITGLDGQDITLHCDVGNLTDEVVLWYKGSNIVASGGNVLWPMYSVDNNTQSLTIIKANDSSKGEYFCELQPDKNRLYTTVVISREPVMDVVVPESSPSMQHNSATYLSSSPAIFSLISAYVCFNSL